MSALLDQLGMLIGLVLTLFIFSYILGDNFLFRLAIYIFVGVTAGYVVVMAAMNVIWPHLIQPLLQGDSTQQMMAIVPLVLGVLLLLKAAPRLSGLGTVGVAYLVGVGAAAAISGAVFGTIFPQSLATMNALSLTGKGGLFNGIIILVGTLATLIYFHFGVRSSGGRTQRAGWIEMIALVGQGFIAVTFGVLFAGVYAAALTALVERWDTILKFILSFFQ